VSGLQAKAQLVFSCSMWEGGMEASDTVVSMSNHKILIDGDYGEYKCI